MTATTIEPVDRATTPELPSRLPLDFELDDAHVASAPAEARGLARDGVRLMVSRGDDEPVHATFRDLADHLAAGDLVVVNTSATVARRGRRRASRRRRGSSSTCRPSCRVGCGWSSRAGRRPGGATSPAAPAGRADRRPARRRHRGRAAPSRCRVAATVAGDDRRRRRPADGARRASAARSATRTSIATGRSTATRPCSPTNREVPRCRARPGRSRPNSPRGLIRRGIGIATITLHTGVSSLEGHELPYAERFAVPPSTAAAVNATRAAGGHVIAVGTTVVRALESAADATGTVHPAAGWTDAVITPATGVRAVDGLVSGWHEPAATHLAMLEAVAGRAALIRPIERHGTPDTCGTSSATATCCFPTLVVDDRDDDPSDRRSGGGSAAGGVSVPPPLPAGRRAVLYAVRRIGDATADDIAEALDMTVSGARQHLTSLAEHGLVRHRRTAPSRRPARPSRSCRTRSPSSPTRCSRRRTARSPTSCSATSRTRTAPPSTGSSPVAATPGSPTPSAGWRRSGR